MSLAVCFTALFIHGTLSDFKMTVLMPVVKDKTGQIFIVENYRQTAFVRKLSRGFEQILFNRILVYITTDQTMQ